MVTIFHKNIDNEIKKYFPEFIITFNMFIYPCFQKKRIVCVDKYPETVNLIKQGFIAEIYAPIKRKKYNNDLSKIIYLTNVEK